METNKKRILLTGGCGFVGHHLLEGLLKNTNWEVVNLDCINYAGNLNRLPDIDIFDRERERIKYVWHDLRAPISDEIHRKLGKFNYIWHIAAESHVDRSLEDSIPFVMSNVLGTAHLLEYVKKHQRCLEKFIYFSTDEVLGPAPVGVYYKEAETPNPSNPYSASKEGGEAIAKAFAFSFGLPIMIARSMNIIGERQHPEKFIPKTIRAILKGERITIHGTPETGISSRCWIHARNIETALRFLMQKGEVIEKKYQQNKQRGIYHIVGEEKDVLYLANRISNIVRGKDLDLEREVEFVDFHRTRPGHDIRYALSREKLAKMGWKPTLSLEESFDKMVRWMIDFKNRHWLNL